MISTLNYCDWDQLSYDQHALTIKDILDLEPGQQIKVLTMDRNVWDCLTDCEEGKSYRPKDLFETNWAIYIHKENLRGKLVFWYDAKNDIGTIDVNQIDGKDFEFHVEYKKGSWYPLQNGYLPVSDPQELFRFPWTDDKKHWTNLPKTTCVGWRGHFVLWSKLDQLPNISM